MRSASTAPATLLAHADRVKPAISVRRLTAGVLALHARLDPEFV
jgi:hypothetical protein